MTVQEHIVNLDLPAEERWSFLSIYKKEMDALFACYLNDFQGSELIFQSIEMYKSLVLPDDYIKEARSISEMTNFSENQVLIANLYYDVLKFYFGCTAFAVSADNSILHARNLDWHTENNLLSDHTTIFNFQKSGVTLFKTVGWPGFIGALSGIRPGAFSVTLNAVLSNDNPELAYPISFLLRDVLEQANDYNSALSTLRDTTIASDCLLLLSGVESEERVVIERTPKRHALRNPENDILVVTNDYKELANNEDSAGVLQATSCGRFDRATSLIGLSQIKKSNDCINILQDADIMMGITVQQMCFHNNTGEILVIKK